MNFDGVLIFYYYGEKYMCGIIGYTRNKNIKEELLQNLQKLEYRGYDSAGLSFFDKNNSIQTYKCLGRISNLKNKISKIEDFFTGIAHTRWATHGKPSDINSHPHNSIDNSFSIVHNGIIENYDELKKQLIKKGAKFISQTDSEVIAHLLYYSKEKNIIDKLFSLFKVLKGSYAIVVLSAAHPNKIFAITNKNPLILGKGDGNMIASDIAGLMNKCNKIYPLKDNDVVAFDAKHITLYRQNKPAKIVWQSLSKNNEGTSLGEFDYYMRKEIYEIPKAMKRTYDYLTKKNVLNFLKRIKKIKTIHFIGCGTAYHSGCIAKCFCNQLKIPSFTHYASEFRYSLPPLNKNDLCVFISQSGETADTLEALKIAKKNKIKTCAITNNQISTIVRLADYVIPISAGLEISVASTKAYNAQLIALTCLIKEIAKKYFAPSTQASTSLALNQALKKIDIPHLQNEIKNIIPLISGKEHIFFIGKDYDYYTCLEASLKLKEISYIHCESFPAGELKHGTLALIDSSSLVIAISTKQNLLDKILNSINEIKSRGASVILICNSEVQPNVADYIIKIPALDDYFNPVISVLPCQLIALETAIYKGFDPDKPRNLAKSVTVE